MNKVTASSLATHPFLRGLDPKCLAALASAARTVVFPARHRIMEAGGNASRFWLIQSGSVAVDMSVPGNGRVVIESLGIGEVLGWSWLIPPQEWAFGATTISPVRAFEFDAAAVHALCAADPELGYELTRRMLRVLAHRLRTTRIRLATMCSAPPERG
jgi:CRP/FNR family cyclic AMP-dependent transcriptional regulator